MIIILETIRVRSYIKNVLVFLLPLSAGQIIGKNWDFRLVIDCCLLFASLSLISSFNYIVNDLVDINADRLHTKKQKRPIPSGRISRKKAQIIALVSLFGGLIISLSINKLAFISVIIFGILQLLYSIILKKYSGFDIVALASLFCFRTCMPYVFDHLKISTWFTFTIFSIALCLATSKRLGELKEQKKGDTRKVLREYNIAQLEILLATFLTSAFILYINWSISTFQNQNQIWTTIGIIPISIILIRVIGQITGIKSEEPESIFSDPMLIVCLIIWIAIYLKAKGYL